MFLARKSTFSTFLRPASLSSPFPNHYIVCLRRIHLPSSDRFGRRVVAKNRLTDYDGSVVGRWWFSCLSGHTSSTGYVSSTVEGAELSPPLKSNQNHFYYTNILHSFYMRRYLQIHCDHSESLELLSCLTYELLFVLVKWCPLKRSDRSLFMW